MNLDRIETLTNLILCRIYVSIYFDIVGGLLVRISHPWSMKCNLVLDNAFENSYDLKSFNYFHSASYVIW